MSSKLNSDVSYVYVQLCVVALPGECLRVRQIWCCLQVTLSDPYLSALEEFAKTRHTNQHHLYLYLCNQLPVLLRNFILNSVFHILSTILFTRDHVLYQWLLIDGLIDVEASLPCWRTSVVRSSLDVVNILRGHEASVLSVNLVLLRFSVRYISCQSLSARNTFCIFKC